MDHQKNIFKSILTQIGANLVLGRGIMSVSLPV